MTNLLVRQQKGRDPMQKLIHNATTFVAVYACQPALRTCCKTATTSTTSKCQPGTSAGWNDRYHAEAADADLISSTANFILSHHLHAVASFAAQMAHELLQHSLHAHSVPQDQIYSMHRSKCKTLVTSAACTSQDLFLGSSQDLMECHQ